MLLTLCFLFLRLWLAFAEARKRRKTVSGILPHYYMYEPNNRTFAAKFAELPPNSRSLEPNFYTEPPAWGFLSYSQRSQQDIVINDYFNGKHYGFFVDLAANEWQDFSNTYALEFYLGWKGLCIEPDPEYLIGLLSNRKCKLFTNAVTAKNNEKVTFRFHEKGFGGLSGIVGQEFDNHGNMETDVTLRTTTLTTILDFAQAPKVMEYLSLDVEGAEYLVLKGLDFHKYTFLAITIERPQPNSHRLLSANGYRYVYQMADFGECIYLHRSKDNFAQLMQQYRHGSDPPFWHEKSRSYLLHPPWNSSSDPSLEN
mmetsp:Transcript_9338/g.15384  ORF Transcript_9338/g.15384 Transcript_9338/m.15384 type:complete len:312 (+) Transcript_9338:36-971(+)|eukprot:CAMPEP_0174957286 /NCGR_PEP_ID=MMETSP0004_2-20121128/1992_1 /TAXON_ID=420556 /ORGANISM="Ochromonas sp., Strain CCMP1393" /LENGTH=311 /DNA_ID=CAMNT_0016205387 /DNA_START=1 /DNA_END=936 /DNA_ORIENTATION=-